VLVRIALVALLLPTVVFAQYDPRLSRADIVDIEAEQQRIDDQLPRWGEQKSHWTNTDGSVPLPPSSRSVHGHCPFGAREWRVPQGFACVW